jgi:protein-L-isoaspartate(D-aspartate) O-methyltransferase
VALLLLLVAGLFPQGALGQDFNVQRREMVNLQLRQRGIQERLVLQAMEQVPRHLFVPDSVRSKAYLDEALPIGPGRAIYQPYVVALMTSLLNLDHDDKVLEVGTGSGYHAAVLSRIAKEVYSIEIDSTVASQARQRLAGLGYYNVNVRHGNGYLGWPDKAPFDAILLSAAPPKLPQVLLDQLRVGGRMVVPLGGSFIQDLLVITKTSDGLEKRTVIPVRLSPMKGNERNGE